MYVDIYQRKNRLTLVDGSHVDRQESERSQTMSPLVVPPTMSVPQWSTVFSARLSTLVTARLSTLVAARLSTLVTAMRAGR